MNRPASARGDPPRRPLIALAVATGGGIGFLRPAPGTLASLAAAALAAGWLRLGPTAWSWHALFAATVLATLLGLMTAGLAARHLGREDPGAVVIDEVAGQWVVYAAFVAPALPHVGPWFWGSAVAAWAAFRFFDILKPWPVRACERLPGALGIMADDLAAGVMATLVCQLLKALVP